MKTILSAILFAGLTIAQAQEVKDYQYVIIPQNLTGFENNQYKLKNRLNQLLKDKNYQTITFNNLNWPDDLKENPCLGLSVDAKRQRSLTTNSLSVEFKNCQNKVIGEFEGVSRVKDFEPGFQDAIAKAIEKIPHSNPKVISNSKNENIKLANATVKDINSSASSSVSGTPTSTLSNLLTDGSKNYQKVDLQQGGFLIMNDNGAQVVAKFEPALKKGIFRVHVIDGNYSTIGYYNENSISFEIKENNVWKAIVLTEKK